MSGRRPESVLVVVHDPASRVLLLERAEPRGFWQSVTGALEPGESPLEAARREVREETGLDPAGLVDCGRARRFPITGPWRERYPAEATHNREHELRLLVTEAATPDLDPASHVAHCWLPLGEAADRASSWTNRAAIRSLPVAAAEAAVVLVHGLWRRQHSMRPLARRLRRAGFSTHLFRYPSTRVAPATAAAELAEFVADLDAPLVHFVGHSLGGIVLAHLLTDHRPARVGRAVLMGTPMRGAGAAHAMERIGAGRSLGAAREQGLLGGAPRWPQDVPVAMLAGTVPMGPGHVVGPLGRPNDGTVALRETLLPGAARLDLPVNHFGMLLSARAARAVAAFLQTATLPEA